MMRKEFKLVLANKGYVVNEYVLENFNNDKLVSEISLSLSSLGFKLSLDSFNVLKRMSEENLKLFYEDGNIGVFRAGYKKPTVEELEVYIRYIEEVEKQRAVERDFIFEKVKELPLGFLTC